MVGVVDFQDIVSLGILPCGENILIDPGSDLVRQVEEAKRSPGLDDLAGVCADGLRYRGICSTASDGDIVVFFAISEIGERMPLEVRPGNNK